MKHHLLFQGKSFPLVKQIKTYIVKWSSFQINIYYISKWNITSCSVLIWNVGFFGSLYTSTGSMVKLFLLLHILVKAWKVIDPLLWTRENTRTWLRSVALLVETEKKHIVSFLHNDLHSPMFRVVIEHSICARISFGTLVFWIRRLNWSHDIK